jgi:hypothetical protein
MDTLDPITGQPVSIVVVGDGDPGDLLRTPASASEPTAVVDPSTDAPVTDATATADDTVTSPATATAEGEPTADQFSEAEIEALKRLGDYLQTERSTHDERTKKAQSSYDRQITSLKGALDERDARLTELEKATRELQLNGLSAEDAAKLRTTWENDDRKAGLDSYAADLTDMHLELGRTILLHDYEEFGVTEDALANCTTVDQMESICKDAAIEFLTTNPGAKTAAPANVVTTPAAPAKPAPAGATAKTDVGGGGAPPVAPTFNQGQGMGALLENLKSMKPTTVQIRS